MKALAICIKHGNQRIGEIFQKSNDETKFVFRTGKDFKSVKKSSCKVDFFTFDKLSGQLRAITYSIDWLANNTTIPVNKMIFDEWSEDNIAPEIHEIAKKVYNHFQSILANRAKKKAINKKPKAKKNAKAKPEHPKKQKSLPRGSKLEIIKEIVSKSSEPVSAEDIFKASKFTATKSNRVYVYVMLSKLEKAKEIQSVMKPSKASERIIKHYFANKKDPVITDEIASS